MSLHTSSKYALSANGSIELPSADKPPSPIKGRLTPVPQSRALEAIRNGHVRSASPVNGTPPPLGATAATAAVLTHSAVNVRFITIAAKRSQTPDHEVYSSGGTVAPSALTGTPKTPKRTLESYKKETLRASTPDSAVLSSAAIVAAGTGTPKTPTDHHTASSMVGTAAATTPNKGMAPSKLPEASFPATALSNRFEIAQNSLRQAQDEFNKLQEALNRASEVLHKTQVVLLEQLIEDKPRNTLSIQQLKRHDELFTRQQVILPISIFFTTLALAAFLQNKLQHFENLSFGEMSSDYVETGARICDVIDIIVHVKKTSIENIKQIIENFLQTEFKISSDKIRTFYTITNDSFEIKLSSIKLSFVTK